MADTTINAPSGKPDESAQDSLATAKIMSEFNLAEALQKASQETRRSPLALTLDYAKASLGKAKLTQDEFFRYRLYDRQAHTAAERSAFVGQAGSNAVNLDVNKTMNAHNIVDEKIIYCAALRALGIKAPVMQLMVRNLHRDTAYPIITDAAAFATFLRDQARYPLFGKPNNGSLSRGAASFDRYDATTDKLIDVKGNPVDPDAFAAEVLKEFGVHGYVIEDRVTPHPELQEVSGQAVGTVRVYVLDDGEGPQPIYAVWKIPSFNAVADNLWRTGNLIGEVDMATGEVVAVRQSGIDGQTLIPNHPGSGAKLIGRIMPDWAAAKDTLRRAAALTPHIPGIGFDLALSDEGPLIIEGNTRPNHGLYQAATGRGFLSPTMREAIARTNAYVQTMLDRQKRESKANIRDYTQSRKSASKASIAQGMKTAKGEDE